MATSCPIALEAGLTESVIQAIRIGERPDFEAQDEALVYDLSRELYWRQRVGDHTYAQAVAVLGEQAVVELIGILGYYALVAMTLNVFEVEASGSDEPPFPD